MAVFPANGIEAGVREGGDPWLETIPHVDGVLIGFFFFAFAILPINGFPIGIAIAREFGAQPTNFVLAASGAIFLAVYPSAINELLALGRVFWPLTVYLLLGAFNWVIVLLNDPHAGHFRDPHVAWVLQFAMLVWSVASFVIWVLLLRRVRNARWLGWIVHAAAGVFFVHVSIFLAAALSYPFSPLGLLGLPAPDVSLIEAMVGSADARPSGLSTEPSMFGQWLVMVFPIFWYSQRFGIRERALQRFYRGLSLLIPVIVILSVSRTGLALFLIQVLAFGLFEAIQKRRLGVMVFGLSVSVSILGLVVLLAWDQVASIWNLSGNESSAARFGGVVAALRLSLDHLWFGVGVGQFTAYAPDYLPEFAMRISEVQNWTSSEIQNRMHAFNLPVRILAEMGIFALAAFLFGFWRAVQPSVSGLTNTNNALSLPVILVLIGGAGFWLTQDLFAFQPAVFSLALAYVVVDYQVTD